VALGILIERREHDWENDLHIVADEVTEILVVPEIKRPLGHLEHVR